MQFTHIGKTYEGRLSAAKYGNDNLAVTLMSFEPDGQYWEPYAKLSVNTHIELPDNLFVAKTYNENEGLIEQFIEAGYFKDSGVPEVACGHCICPVLEITDKFREACKEE